MRSATTRDVIYFDAVLSAVPGTGKVKSMADLMKRIEALEPSERVVWRRKKRFKIYLRAIDIDEETKIAKLLICKNDKDAPDASFADMETDEQRDETKAETEGRPVTSHVLISLTPYKGIPTQYLVLLEDGVSRALVESFLNNLIRICRRKSPDEFKVRSATGERDAKGEFKMERYDNRLDLQGHPSDEIQEAIQNGKILGVSLETQKATHLGPGEGIRVHPKRAILKLEASEGWNMEAFHDALKFGRKRKFEAARLAFKTPDDTSHTAVIDVESEDVIGDGFILRKRLRDFESLLSEAAEEFEEEIIGKMTPMMFAARKSGA